MNFLPINMACCLRTNTFVFPLLVVLQLTDFHEMRSECYAIGGHTHHILFTYLQVF